MAAKADSKEAIMKFLLLGELSEKVGLKRCCGGAQVKNLFVFLHDQIAIFYALYPPTPICLSGRRMCWRERRGKNNKNEKKKENRKKCEDYNMSIMLGCFDLVLL